MRFLVLFCITSQVRSEPQMSCVGFHPTRLPLGETACYPCGKGSRKVSPAPCSHLVLLTFSGLLQTDGLGKCWGCCRSLLMCPLISFLAPVPALACLLQCPRKSARDEAKQLPWPCSHTTGSQKKLSRKDAELRPGLMLLIRAVSAGFRKTRPRLVLLFQSPALGCLRSWHLLLCYPCAVGNPMLGACQREAAGYSSGCFPSAVACLARKTQLSVGI